MLLTMPMNLYKARLRALECDCRVVPVTTLKSTINITHLVANAHRRSTATSEDLKHEPRTKIGVR